MSGDRHSAEVAAIEAEIDHIRKQIVSSLEELKTLARERQVQTAAGAGSGPTDPDGSGPASRGGGAHASDRDSSTGQAQEAGKRFLGEIIEETRRHPLAGLIVAFGIGFFTARLLTTGGRK